MKYLIVIVVILAATPRARAAPGFGYGALAVLDCDVPFAPAPGAIDPGDERLNAAGAMRVERGRLMRLWAELKNVERQPGSVARDRRRAELLEILVATNARLAALERPPVVRRGLRATRGPKSVEPAPPRLVQLVRRLFGDDQAPDDKAAVRPLRYPERPYLARLPHYYGVRQRTYGGVPGGIGRGAFAGCPGIAGLSVGGEFAAARPEFVDQSRAGLFGFEHPALDPRRANALFNPGYGADFGPRLTRAAAASGPPARFGFDRTLRPAIEDDGAESGFTRFGLGDRATELVDGPGFGRLNVRAVGWSRDPYRVRGLPRARYPGGALFAPIAAGPALGGGLYNAPPSPGLRPPVIIR